MNRRLVALLLALVLAGVATFLLIRFVTTADERARSGEELAQVFVAQEDIPAGTSGGDAAAQGLIAQDDVPVRTVPDGAIGSLDSIVGQVATGPIFAGEVIVQGRFGDTVTAQAGLLDIPDGLQAVTVDAGVLEGVAGFVRAGDTVSVVATIESLVDPETDETDVLTQYLIQNATVLAVGRRIPADTQDAESQDQIQQSENRHVFTLGLDAEQIEQLLFAFQEGSVWFTLLPDDEQPSEDTPGRTLEDLFS